jgi:hypothetical protein
VLSRPTILRLRQRSLARGVLAAMCALGGSMRLAGFPAVDAPRPSVWQVIPVCLASWAMVETFRCLRRRWSLYHAGVLILLYAELMILVLTLFLWIYP